MPTPSPEIVQLLTIFAVAFTTPALAKATVLTYGTILAPGRRTVTAALRAMGLANEKEFGKYHRLLNRDRWSPWVVSKILLELLIKVFVPEGCALLIGVDEHIERRWGPKIKYKGVLRDPHSLDYKAGQLYFWHPLDSVFSDRQDQVEQARLVLALSDVSGLDP